MNSSSGLHDGSKHSFEDLAKSTMYEHTSDKGLEEPLPEECVSSFDCLYPIAAEHRDSRWGDEVYRLGRDLTDAQKKFHR